MTEYSTTQAACLGALYNGQQRKKTCLVPYSRLCMPPATTIVSPVT